MTDTVELKSCPFCGGEAVCRQLEYKPDDFSPDTMPYFTAECLECCASTEGERIDDPDAYTSLAALWNTRAAITPQEAAKVLADNVGLLMELGMRLSKHKAAWGRVWASHMVADELRAISEDSHE